MEQASNHELIAAAFLICPECHKRGIRQAKQDILTHICGICGYVLKCSYCGATHSLVQHIESSTKFIECQACGTPFWEDGFDGSPKKLSPRARKRKPKEISSDSCVYCGDTDASCPYCK